ncbi:beta-phosphoglucomutase [Risungbinella massiliensis]|uniref:beta-phosphoglucomutase n=1 Tax=Risungbinella massiliensis TaxID=1329796 RepID=UPI00069B6FC9|nr:beta-phosphoglucomutase [Risungbinella massiliensis]
MQLKGVLFDLDGVIIDSVPLYYQANQMIAQQIGVLFSNSLNDSLRGVSRTDVIEKLISLSPDPDKFTDDDKEQLGKKKNAYYQQSITKIDKTLLLPGIENLLKELQLAGIKIALASSSTNAQRVITQLGIDSYFDYIVDTKKIAKGKPNPAIFLDALSGIGQAAENCIGIEDGVAGIQALNEMGVYTVGVGKLLAEQMKRHNLAINWLVESTEEIQMDCLLEKLASYSTDRTGMLR